MQLAGIYVVVNQNAKARNSEFLNAKILIYFQTIKKLLNNYVIQLLFAHVHALCDEFTMSVQMKR